MTITFNNPERNRASEALDSNNTPHASNNEALPPAVTSISNYQSFFTSVVIDNYRAQRTDQATVPRNNN